MEKKIKKLVIKRNYGKHYNNQASDFHCNTKHNKQPVTEIKCIKKNHIQVLQYMSTNMYLGNFPSNSRGKCLAQHTGHHMGCLHPKLENLS